MAYVVRAVMVMIYSVDLVMICFTVVVNKLLQAILDISSVHQLIISAFNVVDQEAFMLARVRLTVCSAVIRD